MKLSCDLCGGALQMNAGAKDASCKNCGLCYSLEMLREKLQGGAAQKPEGPRQPTVPADPTPADVPPASPVPPAVTPAVPPQPKKAALEQFVMQVESVSSDCLTGYVKSGCISVGEKVYINGDYSKPIRLYRFDSDIDTTHASAGQRVTVCLDVFGRSALRGTHTLTGDPEPIANAYRFSGSVNGYFADLLRTQFSQYTLQQLVQWPGLNRPIDFMLMENGQPKLAIFVIDSNDSRGRYQAQKAARLFGDTAIGCTHFFADYRNDMPYVIDRIRAAMG